jgi:3-hydroxyisobutyrate dehydrogenase
VSKRVGLVGLGNMGLQIGARLSESGATVLGFDLDAGARARFAELTGSGVAESAAELASHSDVVITLLPDGHAVAAALTGEAGMLPFLRPPALVIDMGSSDPAGTRALGEAVAKHAVELVDAPVSGGVARAAKGDLTVMVGGSASAIERCEWIFDLIARSVVRTGELGSGHAMKALNNLLSAATLVATAETMLIGRRFGLDPRTMLEVFNSSTGRNNSTENKIEQFVLSGTFDSGFGLALMAKDVRTALELARNTDTAVPLSDLCESMWRQAADALPCGEDHTAIVRWVETLGAG